VRHGNSLEQLIGAEMRLLVSLLGQMGLLLFDELPVVGRVGERREDVEVERALAELEVQVDVLVFGEVVQLRVVFGDGLIVGLGQRHEADLQAVYGVDYEVDVVGRGLVGGGLGCDQVGG